MSEGRPIYAFSISVEWVACLGADEIGPRRSFMIDALNDLPPEAELTVNFDRQTYRCDSMWRIAPRYTFKSGDLMDWSNGFCHRLTTPTP